MVRYGYDDQVPGMKLIVPRSTNYSWFQEGGSDLYTILSQWRYLHSIYIKKETDLLVIKPLNLPLKVRPLYMCTCSHRGNRSVFFVCTTCLTGKDTSLLTLTLKFLGKVTWNIFQRILSTFLRWGFFTSRVLILLLLLLLFYLTPNPKYSDKESRSYGLFNVGHFH